MPSQRFTTWLIIALAAVLVTAVGGWLGYYLDVRPSVSADPSPTVTVNHTETARATAKPKPRETVTVTETVRVPNNGPTPTVTVTKTVPGPTVTVTETVEGGRGGGPGLPEEPEPTTTETTDPTETPDDPDGQVKGVSYRPPIVLNVDTFMVPEWEFYEAVEMWNEALGCEIFTTEVPDTLLPDQEVVWVTQTYGLTMKSGKAVWGLYTGESIQFDPSYGFSPHVAVHELGHALGLFHNHTAGSIMNVAGTDRAAPSADDIAEVMAGWVFEQRCAA
jgi:hypothetical protein